MSMQRSKGINALSNSRQSAILVGRFGVAVASFVAGTKLLYVEPG